MRAKEPLCRSMQSKTEVYRFTWRSSFDGDAVVASGDRATRSRFAGFYRWFRAPSPDDSPPIVPLPPADWARLQEALIAASFWALDPDEGPLARGLDGAFWTIEGRRKDIFRAISRWSPHDEPVYDLGRLFFEFAGPPLARIEILLMAFPLRLRDASTADRSDARIGSYAWMLLSRADVRAGTSGTTGPGATSPSLGIVARNHLGNVRRNKMGIVPLRHAGIGMAEVRRYHLKRRSAL